jgi:hypothetical protein
MSADDKMSSGDNTKPPDFSLNGNPARLPFVLRGLRDFVLRDVPHFILRTINRLVIRSIHHLSNLKKGRNRVSARGKNMRRVNC